MFRWQEHLENMTCPNQKVELVNEVLLNIYANFIPNKIKPIRIHEALWITQNVEKFEEK